MRIVDVYLGQEIEEKVFTKHGVLREEVEEMLLADEPKYFRTKGGRYMAIGLRERYLTAVFENVEGIAFILTSYPASEWQVKLYRRK